MKKVWVHAKDRKIILAALVTLQIIKDTLKNEQIYEKKKKRIKHTFKVANSIIKYF